MGFTVFSKLLKIWYVRDYNDMKEFGTLSFYPMRLPLYRWVLGSLWSKSRSIGKLVVGMVHLFQ